MSSETWAALLSGHLWPSSWYLTLSQITDHWSDMMHGECCCSGDISCLQRFALGFFLWCTGHLWHILCNSWGFHLLCHCAIWKIWSSPSMDGLAFDCWDGEWGRVSGAMDRSAVLSIKYIVCPLHVLLLWHDAIDTLLKILTFLCPHLRLIWA